MAARLPSRALSRSIPISERSFLSSLATHPRSRVKPPSILARAPNRPSPCLRCLFHLPRRSYSNAPLPPSGTPTEPSSDKSKVNSLSESQASPTPEPRSSSPEPEHQPQSSPSSTATAAENARESFPARFSTFMDNLQSRVLVASQTLNDLTGYSAIEAIKAENAARERDVSAAQARLRDARASYKALTARRASTQREVTTLLARKDSWTPPDLERFTALYRLDHELEAAVSAAATELSDAEADEDRLSAALNAGILKRYHEEQIWSDRIRRQSTWGTWGLMGVNFLLFLVLQFVAEPWKRHRLMKGIAEGERGVLEEVRRELAEVKTVLAGHKASAAESGQGGFVEAEAAPETSKDTTEAESGTLVAVTGGVPLKPSESRPPWRTVLLQPAQWRPALIDLYSERRIDMRMRDATAIAAESVVTGAVVAATLAFALLRRA